MRGFSPMKNIKCEFAQSGMGCANCGDDGFVEGTKIMVESGWRNVASLAEGDLVQTFENGLQPIRQIEKTNVWKQPGTCPDNVCPLFVPAGAWQRRRPIVTRRDNDRHRFKKF